MRLLPFMDIPVVNVETPTALERREKLNRWAEGDQTKLSAGFLGHHKNRSTIDDYVFQIGFIKDDCLVTTKELIIENGIEFLNYKEEEDREVMLGLQQHLELYFTKIDTIPVFGTFEYTRLVLKGKTPRLLMGPNKGGGLKVGQRRWVVYDDYKELVYGPVLP